MYLCDSVIPYGHRLVGNPKQENPSVEIIVYKSDVKIGDCAHNLGNNNELIGSFHLLIISPSPALKIGLKYDC